MRFPLNLKWPPKGRRRGKTYRGKTTEHSPLRWSGRAKRGEVVFLMVMIIDSGHDLDALAAENRTVKGR